MEIWKLKERVNSDVWIKSKFIDHETKKPVINFFTYPGSNLCSLILLELRKNLGNRFIVFSRKEERELTALGSKFLGSSSGVFLKHILAPAKESFREGFIVTDFICEDPNLSPNDQHAKRRIGLKLF